MARVRHVALAVVGVVAAVLVLATWRSSSAPAPRDKASPAASATDTPEAYRLLLGDWLRPDGGYVLRVRGVSSAGTADVAYFNPRPIRVATATARQEGAHVGLFVKFDDVNYPGSTYTLAYDAAADQLKGIYFQAVQRQEFEVVFVRQR
jgi:hypothetical protein